MIAKKCTIFAKKASKEAGYSDLICIFANSQVLVIFSVTLRQAKCLALAYHGQAVVVLILIELSIYGVLY